MLRYILLVSRNSNIKFFVENRFVYDMVDLRGKMYVFEIYFF